MLITNLSLVKSTKKKIYLVYEVNNKFISATTLGEFPSNVELIMQRKINNFEIDSSGSELLCLMGANGNNIIILQTSNNQINIVYSNFDLNNYFTPEKAFFFDLPDRSLNFPSDYEIIHYFNYLLQFHNKDLMNPKRKMVSCLDNLTTFRNTIQILTKIPERFSYLTSDDVTYVKERKMTYLYKYLKCVKYAIRDTLQLNVEISIKKRKSTFLKNLNIEIDNSGDEPVFMMTYPTTSIPSKTINFIRKSVIDRNNYHINDDLFIERLCVSANLDREIVRSIRNSTLMDMAMKTGRMINIHIYYFIERYNLGMSDDNIEETIMLFCERYKVHPGSMYNILLRMYKSDIKFRNFMDDRGVTLKFSKEIKDRLFEDDYLSPENEKIKGQISKDNENIFLGIFQSFGISFQTEDDIRQEYYGEMEKISERNSDASLREVSKEKDENEVENLTNSNENSTDSKELKDSKEVPLVPRKKLLTPDILLQSKVTINGIPIKWIEYKSYTCSGVGFLHSKNLKQYTQYLDEYGNGLMLYGGTISENVISEYPVSLGMYSGL